MKTVKALFLAATVVSLPFKSASADLNSIPDIPDKVRECVLSRYVVETSAYAYAKEIGAPYSNDLDQIFGILAQKVLRSCDDGQDIVIGDQVGLDAFAGPARKLMRKFCDDAAIRVEAMQGVDAHWKNARIYRCRISKLSEVKAAISKAASTQN